MPSKMFRPSSRMCGVVSLATSVTGRARRSGRESHSASGSVSGPLPMSRMSGSSGMRPKSSPGQQRGEAHEVPGQKIAQIGRGQAGGSPVGAAQTVAFRGEQRGKIAAGHGEVAFLGTVHGHDAVENEEQLFQPAPGEAVGSGKERCDHGKSCAEKGCRDVAERVA